MAPELWVALGGLWLLLVSILRAEAEATEGHKRGEAQRAEREAIALAITAGRDAEAAAIAAKGTAEAEAMEEKADADECCGSAAVLDLLIEALPQIAHELAEPMGNAYTLTVVSTDGASAVPKTVTDHVMQLQQMIADTVGVGLADLITSFARSAPDVDKTIEPTT